jgi:hypothetical protein
LTPGLGAAADLVATVVQQSDELAGQAREQRVNAEF